MSASAFLGPDFFANLAARTAARAQPVPPCSCVAKGWAFIANPDGICQKCGGLVPVAEDPTSLAANPQEDETDAR